MRIFVQIRVENAHFSISPKPGLYSSAMTANSPNMPLSRSYHPGPQAQTQPAGSCPGVGRMD